MNSRSDQIVIHVSPPFEQPDFIKPQPNGDNRLDRRDEERHERAVKQDKFQSR